MVRECWFRCRCRALCILTTSHFWRLPFHNHHLHYGIFVLLLAIIDSGVILQGDSAYSQDRSDIHIDDIVAGIEARNSGLQSLYLEYQITTERMDAFYRAHFLAKLMRQGKSIIDALEEVKSAELETIIAASDWPRKTDVSAYDVKICDNARAITTTYETTALLQSRRVKQFVTAFDGEKLRSLDCLGHSGSIGLGTVEDSVPRIRPENFLYVLGKPLDDVLRDAKVDIVSTRVIDGDIFCDLRYQVRAEKEETISTTNITLNMSKGVWPVKIATSITVRDDEVFRSVVNVDSFIKSGTVYYPKSISQRIVEGQVSSHNGSAGTTELVTCEIDRFDINPSCMSSEFVLAFPQETFFTDLTTGKTYVVADEAGNIVTSEEWTLAKYPAGDTYADLKQQGKSYGALRTAVLIFTIVVVCFLTTVLCRRKYLSVK